MIKIVNLTPHEINITGQEPISSSGICRCKEVSTIVGNINGIDIIEKEFGEVDGLPEEVENVYYVVSIVIATAVKGKRNDCFVPGEQIRDESGKIIGCKNLAKV
jgi:hypothetical protein